MVILVEKVDRPKKDFSLTVIVSSIANDRKLTHTIIFHPELIEMTSIDNRQDEI